MTGRERGKGQWGRAVKMGKSIDNGDGSKVGQQGWVRVRWRP